MKINSITIEGMHNIVAPKKYKLDKHNYYYGRNGIGKSTILQAIQLALLGYIPGYGKTNKDIFLHSNSKRMKVELELDDNGTIFTIERTWTKSGQSVTSKTNVNGIDKTAEEITAGMILPVYDFNDFLKLSANKMKEWFLEFLPVTVKQIDWKMELEQCAPKHLNYDELQNQVLQYINKGALKDKELIVDVNSHIKELISYTKAQIDSLQNTICQLVRYDDCDNLDEGDIGAEIKTMMTKRDQRQIYLSQVEMNDRIHLQLNQYKEICKATSLEEDEKYVETTKLVEALNDKQSKLVEAQKELSPKIKAETDKAIKLQEKMNQLKSIITTNGVCPLCKSNIQDTVEVSKIELADLQAKFDEQYKHIQAIKDERDRIQSTLAEMDTKSLQYLDILNKLTSNYELVKTLKASLKELDERDDLGVDYDTLLHELNDKSAKIKANKKYDELTTKLVSDKIKFENNLEILKEWKKLTDVNGLQSSAVSESPFKQLKDNMNNILKAVLGQNYDAYFVEDGKSNSFDFGVTLNGKYISYSTLSSGEKCMFTLAFAVALLELSQCEIKLVLVDDLFDHLDTINTQKLFNSLYNMNNDIQTIFAGVNLCEGCNGIELK